MFPIHSSLGGDPRSQISCNRKKEESQSASTSTEDIAVEHPGTGILGEVIDEDDGNESHLIDLILKMATSLLFTPNLLQTQQRSRLYAAVHRKTYDTPHAPVLPPEPEPKLQPEHVPKYDIVPAPSPTPTPALAFTTFPS
ncbi:hypothetical protein EDB86DRAFT_3243342, partial [Lactarius hatsudake]